MKRKKDSIYLRHILDSINDIEEYTKGISENNFSKNKLVHDAVILQIGIIGEAVKHLSSDFRKLHKDVPWKKIAGMRDKVIHDYFEVDIDAVWLTVEKEIPKLKEKVKEILNKGLVD